MTESPAAHLLGWDCIEFWVGNARTTAGFLMSAFGFHCTGVRRPESGDARQGELRARAGRHPPRRVGRAERRSRRSPTTCARHGDGVHDLAWLVERRRRHVRAPRSSRGARRVRAVVRARRARRAATRPRSRRTATPCTRSSTAAATAASCSEPGYSRRQPPEPDRSVRPVGLTRHRSRRRQRRAGPARRLGALLRRGDRASASCSTSTTTRSRTEYSRADVDGRVGRHRRS